MANEAVGEQGQKVIAAVLRYGSTISTAVMALGVALAFLSSGPNSGPVNHAPGGLLGKALQLDPLAVTQLGILLLLLTPVFRVFVAVIAFGLERDLKYFLISSGVLLIVLGSIVFAVR